MVAEGTAADMAAAMAVVATGAGTVGVAGMAVATGEGVVVEEGTDIAGDLEPILSFHSI